MTKLIPPPPPRAPIGYVGGQPVTIANDWALYLTVGLLNRLGGYEAPSIEDLNIDLAALTARVAELEAEVDGESDWAETEVDFGGAAVYSAAFEIVDTRISVDTPVRVMPSAKAAAGRTADDWAWDGAVFACAPGAGRATVYATFLPGPIVGPRKLQYSVG